MKKIIVTLLVVVGVALAQQQAAPRPQVARTNIAETRVLGPTYSDVYCAGFITNTPISDSTYVAGGWNSPHTVKFGDRDFIYITGDGIQEGAEYALLRRLQDPNQWEPYLGQRKMVNQLGDAFAELGRARVFAIRGNNIGVAIVEFSCDGITPGDLAVPFRQKEIPQFRAPGKFDRFAAPNGKLTGRIAMARDFDTLLGTGSKVYLNVGSGSGVKVGDYFRATRDYDIAGMDEVDALSLMATATEDTQKNPPAFGTSRLKELPRRSLGEMIVIDVTPSSSTALVTFALEDILVGDGVEMMEPAPPPPPPPMNAPTISCTARPATVRVGDTATISCDAVSPDERPVSIAYTASQGTVTGQDGSALLDTTGARPGPVTVRATATDDRNLSASATATVTVEAPPPPPAPSKLNEFAFRPNSARVDNAAKAILDDIALRLQREPDATALVVGFAGPNERNGAQLAGQRANNAAAYLVQEKGIDARRVQPRVATDPGTKVEVWLIPAGATIPE
jgi:outer membrane protein OmpA-like peptidoglycan-associated protein